MNYIRDLINHIDWEDDIHDLFEHFVEEVNEIPFVRDYENTPEFQLNQRIIQNAYLLRRTMELYPQEQRESIRNQNRLRRSTALPQISVSPLNRGNISSRNASRFRVNSREDIQDIQDIENILFEPRGRRHNRNNAIDINYTSSWPGNSRQIWNPLDLNIASSITDNIFNSLFTNFNQYIEENLHNFQDFEDVKVTLSQDEFEKLDKVTNKSELENKQCNICLEDLKEDDIIKEGLIKLKCNHIYHTDCIKEWLTKQSTKCPSCRNCCRTSTNTE
jgi:hypothetical protein